MTHTARTKIAAAVVVLFLAALSAAGLLSHTLAPGAGVTGQAPSAVHATPAPAQTHPQSFQYESND
ncbi:MAG TPA: hypothetical protein VFB39_14415 [Solirubrobacteraceae bacterium]|nr:hypothetical protein [Solirubrobacteraceae bacterium]